MSGRFWPICEPAQADYEQLRAIVLTGGDVVRSWRHAGSRVGGWPG
jgi:hypothetical protein